LPPLLFCGLDLSLTLLGQPPEYWAGDYRLVNEASPTFHDLLAYHPLAFLAGEVVWVALFTGLILLLPETLALIACIAIVFGHTAGAASWIVWRFELGYPICHGLFLLSAIVLALGIRTGFRAPLEARGPERNHCR
jgi:hypothetical protein